MLSKSDTSPELARHDAFRNGGGPFAGNRLGKRAGEIFQLLSSEPLTFDMLCTRTGASKKTVRRALAKLGKVIDPTTGEVIEMVTCQNGIWRAQPVDLDLVARITGTSGATEKHKIRYEKERRDHARSLEIGALKSREKSLSAGPRPSQTNLKTTSSMAT